MTHAVGLGFDWLYHYLSPAQRQAVVAGVSRMGFDEALAQYAKNAFWANCTFNWGVVVNGGLTVGGLAFADEPAVRDKVKSVLLKAAAGIQCPFSSFAPHGAWHEGSMYWQYVAEYAVATTEALRGVYDGDDHGLSDAPGFNETALFRLHMNGPRYVITYFSLYSVYVQCTSFALTLTFYALTHERAQPGLLRLWRLQRQAGELGRGVLYGLLRAAHLR